MNLGRAVLRGITGKGIYSKNLKNKQVNTRCLVNVNRKLLCLDEGIEATYSTHTGESLHCFSSWRACSVCPTESESNGIMGSFHLNRKIFSVPTHQCTSWNMSLLPGRFTVLGCYMNTLVPTWLHRTTTKCAWQERGVPCCWWLASSSMPARNMNHQAAAIASF